MFFFRKKISHIFVGPIPISNPSGQSICFSASSAALEQKTIFDSNLRNPLSLIRFLFLLPLCCFTTSGVLYFTGSRTFQGFLRDLWVVFWAKVSNRKLINHIHGNDFKFFYSNSTAFVKKIIDLTYYRIDILISPCKSIFQHFSKYSNIRFEHVNNFSNLELSAPIIQSSRFENQNIIFLSNISYSKGITKAIDACHLLHKRGLNIKLDICGSIIGDDEMSYSDLKSIIDSSVDYPYIQFHGYVSNDIKASLLSQSAIMLHPTSNDLAPLSIIEALCTGSFVISTDIGCINKLLVGFNSIVCENQIMDIVTSVEEYFKLSIEERKMMALHNSKLANDKYSVNKYKSKIISIFDSL